MAGPKDGIKVGTEFGLLERVNVRSIDGTLIGYHANPDRGGPKQRACAHIHFRVRRQMDK
jgi:hypothetical protein